MKQIQDFKTQYTSDYAKYEKFGKYVTNEITKTLTTLYPYIDSKVFFKLMPTSRPKDIESLIDKAFFRGKEYRDPYNEITDKVGARFIVLTISDVKKVCDAIESIETWSFSKDRDFDIERKEQPLVFTYQSDHFIVTLNQDILFETVTIPKGFKCEVQVRTLLQHAFAEMSHFLFYKPKLAKDDFSKRLLARSAALIEVTDDKFETMMNEFNAKLASERELLEKLTDIYSQNVTDTIPVNEQLNHLIIQSFHAQIDTDINPKLDKFTGDNDFIFERIRSRIEINPIFAQPSIIFLYYLAETIDKNLFIELFPLQIDLVQNVYSDLGDSIHPSED